MSNSCIFEDILPNCARKDADLLSITEARFQSVLKASKRRGDNIDRQLRNINHESVVVHDSCLKSYTSEAHIQSHLKRLSKEKNSTEAPDKKTRRSLPAFDFKINCVFCGEYCSLNRDPKHPSRWRAAYLVRTTERGKVLKPFKEVILNSCKVRGDDWADNVSVRVNGAITDLHSAEARYHDDCRKNFMGARNIQFASNKENVDTHSDVPLKTLQRTMLESPQKIWSSMELESGYVMHGGVLLSRQQLVRELQKYFGDDVLVLSSPGIANIIIFRTHASSLLHIIDEDEDSFDFVKLGKTIQKEISVIPKQSETFTKRINFQVANDDVSPTLTTILESISPKFKNSLPAALIGNMITSIVANRSTPLQVSLAILANKQKLIQHLYDYGITCSPDEARRFKISAAAACVNDHTSSVLSAAEDGGLVQAVIDNFDTAISSQNGLQQTHSLAMLLTQPEDEKENIDSGETIPRLKKCDLKDIELKDIPVHYYQGPKKPHMPDEVFKYNPLPLRILAHQAVIVNGSKEKDLEFLKAVCDGNSAEYAGFNTKYIRETGVALKPKNKTLYTPLIDRKPSDPSTVMTAMFEAKRITNETGQIHTIITADQQIYRVMVDVTWVDSEKFQDFVLRLGGMHLLMSFVGSVGNLMMNSGLEELMKSAFAGVSKMLSGKNFPMNVRALRMVVEELLRHRINTFTCYDEMIEELNKLSDQSRTAKHWIANLVKPVLIMMMYVRAEREGEWPLHLYSVKEMIPYFFASGHVNYARYCVYYLKSMQRLPDYVLKKFMEGQHVMRHQKGLWNGLWSDMYIETTFMRHGKGPRGLVGVTLKPKTVKQWALSLHACAQLLMDLEEMRERKHCKDQVIHKEELPGRIKSDGVDRNKIREKLKSLIHPLDINEHPDALVNIYSGTISPKSVNVDSSHEVGKKQQDLFDKTLPDGFYQTLTKEVVTMAATKKSIKVGETDVYDTELIFARVMCLLNAGQVQLEDVFSYELSPVPVSLFKENGEMRFPDNKSDLKRVLKVEVSARLQPTVDAVIIDGGAMLWAVYWPDHGTVNDLVQSIKVYVMEYYKDSDIYLIFDRYFEYSPKGSTRLSRTSKSIMHHQLTADTPLPSRKVALGSYSTKQQLITIIVQGLEGIFKDPHYNRKLIITGSEKTTQVEMNGSRERDDLRSTQEEADVIIIQQLLSAVDEGANSVKVVCDDTDVFVLLMHFYHQYSLDCNILMEATSGERTVISIPDTVRKNQEIVDSLLALHALSGCDTVPQMCGIGKKTALNVLLKNNKKLLLLGRLNASLESIIEESCKFVAACYGIRDYTCMTKSRYTAWSKKLGNKTAPKLKSLPPTIEVLTENIKRAHFQAAIWRNSDKRDPPSLDPCNYGWFKDEETKCLLPVMFPASVKAAPPEVLKLIRCGCLSESPCSMSRCSCCKAQMSCSQFCTCFDGHNCCNKWTVFINNDDEHDDCDVVE